MALAVKRAPCDLSRPCLVRKNAAILDRFRHMRGPDCVLASEIRDGPRHTQCTMRRARAPTQACSGSPQELVRRRVHVGMPFKARAVQGAVRHTLPPYRTLARIQAPP